MSLKPNIYEFPFSLEPRKIIQILASTPQSFFLDSADLSHSKSCYSYAGMNPTHYWIGSDNPWPKLNQISKELLSGNPSTDFFSGGLVGYLAYENYQFLDPPLPCKHIQTPVPGYFLAFYPTVLVIDHQNQKTFLASLWHSSEELKKQADQWIEIIEQIKVAETKNLESILIKTPDQKNYRKKIDQIKSYLKEGDVYQINLTERFELETSLSATDLYLRLRKNCPAPYGAFINGGDFQIFSASPECFLKTNGDQAITQPIKGTIARSENLKQDEEYKKLLYDSAKDRAELLMIVDLERNDLGKVCDYGTVQVKDLFSVESFSHLHHLVATITGKIKTNQTPLDALKALFPGGSVTGAPKKRAMEIIQELEVTPRSVYTGVLGFLGPGNLSQWNLPIRTFTKVGKKVFAYAGGGIVIDSNADSEYEEMWLKAKGMLEVFDENLH